MFWKSLFNFKFLHLYSPRRQKYMKKYIKKKKKKKKKLKKKKFRFRKKKVRLQYRYRYWYFWPKFGADTEFRSFTTYGTPQGTPMVQSQIMMIPIKLGNINSTSLESRSWLWQIYLCFADVASFWKRFTCTHSSF